MAELIPNKLSSNSSVGEKRVFAALANLDDQCLVYYEPVVQRRYPDFIVILPKVGVLIIEVKGWYCSQLVAANHEEITINMRGKEEPTWHPTRQARNYMYRLMDECRAHGQAELLMEKSGTYANRLAYPFCNLVVLSNISRHELDNHNLTKIFPHRKCITKDEFCTFERLRGHEFEESLKTFFDPWWPFPKMTQRHRDALRGVIHPEVFIRQSEPEWAVLDLRQERNARAIGDGHQVIFGVVGSGKTVLLIARAKLLAEDKKKRILLLCHNKLLSAHLANAVKGYNKITVKTFHGWGVSNGVEFHKDNAIFGEHFLVQLKNGARDCGQYDAVLIDEAQDWPCTWFQCAKLALREPETGDLLIVADGSQSLYPARGFKWADAGVNVKRAISKKFDLDRNYRNTTEILRVARPFSKRRKNTISDEDAAICAMEVKPEQAMRSGPEPQIIELCNVPDECQYAAALIETWLLGGVNIKGGRQRLKPSDVAVLYPRREQDHSMHVLCERINGFTRAAFVTNDNANDICRSDAVRILTMHSSRGLQFRVAILMATDVLDHDSPIDRSLLYVAMTRAQELLVILHSGQLVGCEELYRNNLHDSSFP